MLKYITILLTIVSTVVANDFAVSQHNFKLSSGDFDLEIREMLNTRKDHIQIGYNGIPKLSLEYRYADAEQTENRLRATYDAYTWKWFALSPRLEYRIFEDDGLEVRFRTILDIEIPVHDKISLWSEFQPGFTFNGAEFDTQTRLGFYYKIKPNVLIAPFVQMNTDEDFNRASSWFGSNLVISF